MRRFVGSTNLSRVRHSTQNYRHQPILVRSSSSTTPQNEKPLIRIAIGGGGVTGLSTALQLAPLVERGLIAKPIDLYERTCLSDIHPHEKSSVINEHFHPGTGTLGRDIGVGIWSTALQPFLRSSHKDKPLGSHVDLIEKLEHLGQYVDKVGYRTPSGSWLTKTRLNPLSVKESQASNITEPSLLFIREKDFLSSLREVVAIEEEEHGTIRTHYAKSTTDTSTQVDQIILPKDGDGVHKGLSGSLLFNDQSTSPEYNIIIAADGMESTLRSKYAGYESYIKRWKQNMETMSEHSDAWEKQQIDETNAIEDRKYVVFRGNSPLNNSEANMDGVSFQTWGEGKSMRFAAVGMSHPNDNDTARCEKQVWFATICDAEICSKNDAEERKQLLLASFQEWHDPVCRLIESTPAEDIFMEGGVAHKHSLVPVLNLADVINYQARSSKDKDGYSTSYPHRTEPGPILLFAGDAFMTVDPVLAQGFTITMEAAADLAITLESCLGNKKADEPAFDSEAVRKALVERNDRRYGRIMCLIRSTELVQSMAQPVSDSFASLLTRNVVRPAMRFVPCFIKKAAFSRVMKYSLGYYGDYTLTGSTKDNDK